MVEAAALSDEWVQEHVWSQIPGMDGFLLTRMWKGGLLGVR